jgi:hypothetical protein
MSEETIEVICFCTPKAEIFFIPKSKGDDYLKKVLKSWQERNKDLFGVGLNISSGMVHINMLKSAYDSLSTNNGVDWP